MMTVNGGKVLEMPPDLEHLFEERRLTTVLSSRIVENGCYESLMKIGNSRFGAEYAIAKFTVTGLFISCDRVNYGSMS